MTLKVIACLMMVNKIFLMKNFSKNQIDQINKILKL
jgi:hypothetical protein